MKWFEDLQIRTKLLLSFGVVIALVIVSSVTSIATISTIDGNYSYILEMPQHRLALLNNAQSSFINLRRLTVTVGLYSGNVDKINSLKPDIDQAYVDACDNIDQYILSTKADTRRTPEIQKSNSDDATTLKNEIVQYKERISEEAIQFALVNDQASVRQTIEEGQNVITSASDIIEKLVSSATDYSAETSSDITESSKSSVFTQIALSVVLVLLAGLIAFFIARVITKPIKKLVGITKDLANGNLNVNTMSASKDEVGVLVTNFFMVIDVLKSLVDGLSEMAEKQHLGNIDVYIEEDNFIGSYKQVVVSVNRMVSEHITENKEAMGCIGDMVGGDFSAQMRQLPGKKVFVNEAIEHLRESLKDISGEVNQMIKNTIDGNLSARIDVKKYKGDWMSLMSGLNEVLSATASPIQEALSVIQEMAHGNFDATMTGNYNGDFNSIKVSVNETVKNISSYINEISAVLNEMANNNLNQEIQREYVGEFSTIRTSLNKIITKLNDVMNEISSAAEQVAAGAGNVSESSMTLAQGATEQAAAVEQLNATVIGVDDKMKTNDENTKKAEQLSNQSKENASIGNSEMKNMLQSMQDINNSSNNISKIIKVIDDIAFQTNLLALNAAIEAARAGQHGKGFAVVAEEVRSLAGRSQTAASEITELIEDSIDKVNQGTGIATATANALEKIVSDVTQVSSIITEISIATNEQAYAMSQINTGVNQIADVVQSNSATSEESAAAAEELSSQSEMLKKMIQVFELRQE